MALEAMERCISDLRKWMYRDKLKINDDKTEFLVIGSRQQLLKIHHCSVRVGTIDIKHVKVALNLGALFESHFSILTHHRTKNQVSGNLNMVETRDSVAETQRQTCVSVSGCITVSHVSVAAFSTEPEHFFTCFRQISVSGITYFRNR